MKLRPRNTAKVPTPPPCQTTCTTAVPQHGNAEFLQQIKTYVQSYVSFTLGNTKINTINSVTGGGSLSGDLTIQLENDELSPGAMEYYGTDYDGVKGYHMIPVGGSVQYQDEGTNLGVANTVTTVNFTGPLITASRTGNTVKVDSDILVDAFNVPI